MGFAVHHPTSLADALALAERHGRQARFLAGGTDLVIQLHRRRVAAGHLVDLSRIDGLARIDVDRAHVTLGALATHRQIERYAAFQDDLIALVEAARVVGGHQIRNVGTVGGNIVNASPAADVVAPLLALDAELMLAGRSGERRVALDAFLDARPRADAEILATIRFARLPPRSASAFLKSGRRRAMEISVVCVAATLTLGADGRIGAARLALGAVGPRTLRARGAEAMLEGQTPSEPLLRAAGERAAADCAPISDVRASAEYRRLLVATQVERALALCLARMRP